MSESRAPLIRCSVVAASTASCAGVDVILADLADDTCPLQSSMGVGLDARLADVDPPRVRVPGELHHRLGTGHVEQEDTLQSITSVCANRPSAAPSISNASPVVVNASALEKIKGGGEAEHDRALDRLGVGVRSTLATSDICRFDDEVAGVGLAGAHGAAASNTAPINGEIPRRDPPEFVAVKLASVKSAPRRSAPSKSAPSTCSPRNERRSSPTLVLKGNRVSSTSAGRTIPRSGAGSS